MHGHQTKGMESMLMRLSVLVAMALVLAGCAQQIQPATKHSPGSPNDVKFYQKGPSRYEELGLIHVPVGGAVKWDQFGDADAGFEQFKEKAAALGANGVLFVVPPGASAVQVTAGYKGTYYAVPMKMGASREAVAQAIFVLKP